MVKICHAERCVNQGDHTPIAFLWLRSAVPNALDERYDVELACRMAQALSPVITRCVQATKPTHDFRRRSTAVQSQIGPSPA